jgi:hypothetical protein
MIMIQITEMFLNSNTAKKKGIVKPQYKVSGKVNTMANSYGKTQSITRTFYFTVYLICFKSCRCYMYMLY